MTLPIRRMLLCAALALSLAVAAAPATATDDTAPWGPLIGRTSQVRIEKREHGDVHAAALFRVLLPSVSASSYEIVTECDGADVCNGLYCVETSGVFAPGLRPTGFDPAGGCQY